MKLLLVLLALLALFQMTVSASAPGVKAEVPNTTAGTSIALVFQDEEIFNKVTEIVRATGDNKAAELFAIGTGGV